MLPDMWVDPDDDPRNTDGVSPDGELATLLDYLSDYRMTLLMKCEGLDASQLAQRSVPPSTMSLLGLLRHLAEVERDWRNWVTTDDPLPRLYGLHDADFDGAAPDQALVDAARADLAREQAETDALLAEHPDPDERVGHAGIAIRELLVHRVEEYARHCGHADSCASASTVVSASETEWGRFPRFRLKQNGDGSPVSGGAADVASAGSSTSETPEPSPFRFSQLSAFDELLAIEPTCLPDRGARWVDSGDVVTSAGVSAGIDMALHLVDRLAGTQRARDVRRAIQYDPEPPL